ncbi:hypothetical protein GPJ56_005478 [Histomonas meleagridis]|uniref:uncharacterized protein n=1 Tax=Histomonas meleagridis TaxID=135588 RepID=UPI003559D2F1|nr:hypothetical protein GPJ56_005478 [Histomonas meleagridis]KAH0802502.1 hypothetical protein GO595_004551 [Histomonas meleagridis]
MALSDPNKIIELIIETKLKVPKLFVSWANTTRKNPYKFDESKIIEVGLNQLPPMLRMQMLQKVPNEMSSPRLCRAVKFNKSLQKEIKKRIAKEKDPRQLHDFLLASSEKFSIPNSLPFYYTLLAKWCIGDPNLSHLYLSEFSKLDDKTDIEILTAAVIGLELLSSRYPDTVPLVFPKIRHLMKKCPKVIRIHLLNAIAYAVGSETIDEEFVWNDYHSIRTVSEDGLDFDDLIHYCIIGLNDPDDVEIAKPLLDKLCKKDKISVISGLLRLPYEKVSHFNSLISLLPEKEPIVNSKTDILAEVVNEELQKPMTTSRMLQLATAFTMFFDVFKNVTVEWIKILVEAGECVFNMSVSQSIIERCLATIASKDIKDERIRFSCGFSLALYLSYRLIDEPNQISQILHNITPSEKSDLVQLIYLYTLSLCPAPSDAESFIIKMIADGKRISSTNVLFGVGYCIQSWFSSILTFFNKPSNRNLKSIGVWPFASNVLHFLNRDFEINTNDKLGLAQFIYLQRSNPSFDTLIDNLIEKEELDSETLLCAICGYIPDLAFRITSFSPDERQRTLISHVQDLNELTNQLITRQRLYHKQQSQQKVQRNIRPMIEQLRSDYEKLTNNEVAMILSSLSKTQIGEIVNDTTSDCSIFVAIKLRSIDDISRLISMKRQNEKYLNLLKNEISEENLILIVEKMIEINAPIERIAEVLVYYRFDELLAEVNCVAIAPILIAEMKHIKIEMVMSLISNYKEIADDFIKCLLLKKPQFFQQNNEVFELIK